MLIGKKSLSSPPEIWGGLECTINRVGNAFRDQLLYTGHYSRDSDIHAIAQLGVRALRYPVLWEHHQPIEHTAIDWSFATKRLNTIRSHDIIPIIGLVHHGSGPAYTNLCDESFATGLATYAGMVAAQFPWVQYYTPVNEPLTTARFSGLYGHWYPHHREDKSFILMLLNQLRAVVRSMQAIRKVNPSAQLIQTEDLAKVHSTGALAYQADFENERRWLTYDLLFGRVDKDHYLWNYLASSGVKEKDILFFRDNPCPPAIIGLNYYITSERFLDDNITRYPPHLHGGNAIHQYVDVEMVRIGQSAGVASLLEESWGRYATPVALTEVHLNCSREKQMRWWYEIWQAACKAKENRIDVRAVTAWSLLGAYDWNSLLTENNHQYETGVFNLSKDTLKPTATARLIHDLAIKGSHVHPLLDLGGWWHSPSRLLHGTSDNDESPHQPVIRPILILGKSGTLGSAFEKICANRSIPFVALSKAELDILDQTQMERAIDTYRPWAIINAAGFVKVDEAELHAAECFDLNTNAPALLAGTCRAHGIRFMTFSTDLVFDGKKKTPYTEKDSVTPLSVYGQSKARAELLITHSNPGALIIRTSTFFGPWDRYNFAYDILQSLQQQGSCCVAGDVTLSPTYVPDLVHASLDLLIDGDSGIWHLCNDGVITWKAIAHAIVQTAGYSGKQVFTKAASEMNWKAPRPEYSALQSERGVRLPGFTNALDRFFKEKML